MINLGNSPKIIAYNRCSKRGHEWRDKPMGFAEHMACPTCESQYWAWINFKKSPA